MLVYYFVPFIVSNRYLLFWVSNGHNSVNFFHHKDSNRYLLFWVSNGHNSVNFFHHKDLGNHLLQLCPKVVKHPVYAILMLSNSLRMIKTNRNMSEVRQIVWKNVIVTLENLLVLLCGFVMIFFHSHLHGIAKSSVLPINYLANLAEISCN